MNCDVFIPVRLSSKRLPEKSLKIVSGKPILQHLVERLSSCSNIRHIIVCTTNRSNDDKLVHFLDSQNIKYFRGDDQDLLSRLNDTAKQYETDFIVSVDGDDIYTDPLLVDKIVAQSEKTHADFINMIDFPFGMISVGFTALALDKICTLKKTQNTGTGYRLFFSDTNVLSVHNIQFSKTRKFDKNIRLTLDYEEDLTLAKKIFEQLGNDFHLDDILDLFGKYPSLLKITSGLNSRWKEHWNNNVTDLSLAQKLFYD